MMVMTGQGWHRLQVRVSTVDLSNTTALLEARH
jgi:hypothetical protein